MDFEYYYLSWQVANCVWRYFIASILDEANVAFELNTGLFTILRAPSSYPSHESADIPVLGDPTSPIVSSSPSPSPPDTKTEFIPAPSPLQSLTQDDTDDLPVKEKGTFPLGSVIAFILALCLSHFVLVTNGFTGAKGYAKLENVFEWITNLFGASTAPAQ